MQEAFSAPQTCCPAVDPSHPQISGATLMSDVPTLSLQDTKPAKGDTCLQGGSRIACVRQPGRLCPGKLFLRPTRATGWWRTRPIQVLLPTWPVQGGRALHLHRDLGQAPGAARPKEKSQSPLKRDRTQTLLVLMAAVSDPEGRECTCQPFPVPPAWPL